VPEWSLLLLGLVVRITVGIAALWAVLIVATRLAFEAPYHRDLLKVSSVIVLITSAPLWFVLLLPEGIIFGAVAATSLIGLIALPMLLSHWSGVPALKAVYVTAIALLGCLLVSMLVSVG
jgi:hypothetical protein